MKTKTVYSIRSEGDYETFVFIRYSDINAAKKAFADLTRTIIRAYTLLGIRISRRDNKSTTLISLVDGPLYLAGTEIIMEETEVEYDD